MSYRRHLSLTTKHTANQQHVECVTTLYQSYIIHPWCSSRGTGASTPTASNCHLKVLQVELPSSPTALDAGPVLYQHNASLHPASVQALGPYSPVRAVWGTGMYLWTNATGEGADARQLLSGAPSQALPFWVREVWKLQHGGGQVRGYPHTVRCHQPPLNQSQSMHVSTFLIATRACRCMPTLSVSSSLHGLA